MVGRRDILHFGLGAAVPALCRDSAAGNVLAQVGGNTDTSEGAASGSLVLQTDLASASGASHIGLAGGGTVQSAIAVAATPAALLASSVVLAEGSTIRTANGFHYQVAASGANDHDLTTAGGVKLYYKAGPSVVNALAFGAVGDGTTSNTAFLQAALDFAAKARNGVRAVYLPSGIYLTGTIYVPAGVRFFGESGVSETTVSSGTKLLQAGAGDVIRFAPYLNGTRYYWWGEISHLTIWGATSETSGWGVNFKDVSGNSVIPQDSNFLHHLTIRGCYEGGINLPSGAFPLCISDCKFLFNNGPGIKLTRVTNFQSVHFLNISGDGNNGGIISLNSLNDGFGSVLITNLKSEARVNFDYGGVECQNNPIVCTSCNDLPLVINGATHISSIPDGAVYKKPGDLVSCPSGGTPPQLTWSGVAIRVRGTDTGADPKIIGGAIVSPTVASAAYTVTAGYFNQTVRLFNARIAKSRATASDGDTTPTVATHNCLLLNNTSATTITTFDDGIEGQVLHVIANNGHSTLVNGADLRLAAGDNFVMAENDACTLIYVAGSWRELCRTASR